MAEPNGFISFNDSACMRVHSKNVVKYMSNENVASNRWMFWWMQFRKVADAAKLVHCTLCPKKHPRHFRL